MSPILVRPVREQLEHDRVIRQLQKDLSRRKYEVSINPGAEQNAPVGTGARREFPDVVLFSPDKNRKVLGVIEVETGESVNHLEVMAQWAHYARLKVPFYLYVPVSSVDVARRLAADHQIPVAEIHTYHQIGDVVRFASAYRSGTAPKLPDDPLPPEPASKAKPVVPVSPALPAKKPAMPAAAKPGKPSPAAPAPEKNGKASTKPAPKASAPLKAVPVKSASVKPAAVKAVPAKPAPAKAAAGKPAPAAKKAASGPKKAVARPQPAAKKAARPVPAKKAAPKKAGKRK